MEFDFYTAVDDLRPEDTEGADMLGTVEFNSACFYRYSNVDARQLRKNLGGDEELARQTVGAFLRASVAAVPTGKQNSMAAQNPPSLVLAVVRRSGLWSLANAFSQPVRPAQDADLVQSSVWKLDDYWGRLAAMYGHDEIVEKCVVSLDGEGLSNLNGGARSTSVEQLVERVLAAVRFDDGEEG
jgi:CRISPR system Cascade subunit CasC